ncbi:MAG: EAL domain-containing protein [Burkholderiales bacterium]|nr:EAL domain-containing protein [Burkholderiales bacterium]
MKPSEPFLPEDANREITALIQLLHRTEQRLEALTGGEVDAVADQDGRTLLLQRAQDHQRHSEAARQAAILNALPAHIALLDAQGRILAVNQAWQQFAGANALQGPDYAIGVNYLEVCERARGDDAADARRAAAGIRAVLDGSEMRFSIEYPCHSPAQQRWFLMTITPLTAGPRPNGAVAMHLNITERKTAELALQEKENQLSEALAIARIGYWEYEYSSDEFIFNDQYYSLHRTTAADAGGYRMSSADFARRYMYAEDAVIVGQNVRLAFESPDPGYSAKVEVRVLSGNGDIIWVETRINTQKDLQGNTIRLIGVNQDITERKRAEDALRESESRFRALTEMSSDFYWQSDAEHRLNARTSANETPTAVAAFARGTQIGKRRWEIEHLSPDAAGWQAHRVMLDARLPFRDFELSRLGADGVEHYISVSGDPTFSASGAFEGYRGVGKDITERKAAEQRISYLNRVYAVLSGINTLIVRVHDQATLFGEACRVAVELGGFRMSWIGMVDRDATKIVLAGSAGVGDELLSGLKDRFSSGEDASLGTTIAAEVIREKKVIVTRDLLDNPLVAFGKQYAECGIGSMAILPLLNTGEAVGVLALYAEESEFFHAGELKLLTELAGDIAFAIENIEVETTLAHLSRIQAVMGRIGRLIVHMRDSEELFREACVIAVEAGGFRMSMLCLFDRSTTKIVPVASAGKNPEVLDEIKNALSSGAQAANTLIAQAIRERKAVVANRSQEDSRIVIGNMAYREAKINSIAVLPLIVADETLGVLVLYANEPDFFDEAEMTLLTDLTDDIAFAMDNIEKAEKLNYLAYYDALTGLANRTLFLERLAQHKRNAVRNGQNLALFLIDLERFRNINDSLGRVAGDALLCQVAEWLTQMTGDASLLARIDSDHFAGVLPEVKREGNVARLMEKEVKAFMEHPFRLNEAIFRIVPKIGIAIYPGDGADAETLFRNAEAALKKAKASGERYLFYTQSMMDSVAGKLSMENKLRLALDDGEFVLHYQPKVSLASGKLMGAEALIRWNDPRNGLVPPGRFIPILEETGLIHEVGRWALHQAIADYLRWRAAGLPAVRIAVNVSALQLRNRGFIEEVRQAIGVDAQAAAGLELEITESLIMEDVKGTIASLQVIRELGVSIAVDDFGTGFSSLAYLAKLPVNTLKIDRSFVIDMTAGPQGLALVSTIIKLAHSLELNVVAEGVETEEQSHLLRLLACDEMQGFLFSKPVPRDIFETRFLAPPAAAAS